MKRAHNVFDFEKHSLHIKKNHFIKFNLIYGKKTVLIFHQKFKTRKNNKYKK